MPGAQPPMPEVSIAHGMIAVDKMGGKILFLNPKTYETETVLDGFPRTVHELLIVPETGLAYVPIFGDGVHGRNPRSEEHTSELQSHSDLVCRLLLEKKKDM